MILASTPLSANTWRLLGDGIPLTSACRLSSWKIVVKLWIKDYSQKEYLRLYSPTGDFWTPVKLNRCETESVIRAVLKTLLESA